MKKIHFTLFPIMLLFLIAVASAAAYEVEIEHLADSISKQMAKAGRKQVQRIAVVDFTDLQGNITELGRFIAEELSVNLARSEKHFEIIDRTHLKSLIEEHKFSMSGLVDPQTARQLGKIAGVDAIVTGKLTPFGDNVRVSCTVIATSTAKTIAAGKTSIAKTRTIEQLLAGGGIGPAAPVERDQDRDAAERQQRARDVERERADREKTALDRLKEEQRKLDAERRRLEEDRLKQEQTAKDREKLEKINEEQRKLEAERLRIEAERKRMAEVTPKPAPVPAPTSLKRSYTPLATRETEDFIFDLMGVKIWGDEVTVSVVVVSKSDEPKNIAFYDEAYRWTKSKFTDDRDRSATVAKVSFWKGDQQSTMYNLGTRGITVEPKTSVTAQLVFTKVKSDARTLKSLVLHPFIYHRVAFVWRWLETDVAFDNLRLVRSK